MSMSNRKNYNSMNTQRNERAYRMKVYSICSVIILGVIVFLLNILVDVILGKSLTFDFSMQRSYSISEASINYLESLPADTRIRIVGLFMKPESTDEEAYRKYQYIIPLIDDYVKKGKGKISVEYVDITMNPGIISELDPSGSNNLSKKSGQYVVSYNGKIDVIDPIDCYTIDTDYLDKYDVIMATGNNTEYTFTNSIMSLVNGYTNKAYVMTFSEENGSSQLMKILSSMGIEPLDIDSTKGFKVPDDCNLLVLNCPDNDITETMYIEIKAYLEKGGKIIVAVDYDIENVNESYSNLNRLLNEVNINIEKCMVTENDPKYQLNSQINDSLADVAKEYSDYTSNKQLHITLARPLSYATISNPQVVTKPVLMTSSSATRSVADYDNTAKQLDFDAGISNVAMYSYNKETTAEVLVFGTANFTSDLYYSEYMISDNNAVFIRSFVRSMVPSAANYNIDIPVKQVDSYLLAQDKATTTMSTTMMIVFMIVLPIICSTAAVIVYNKRKNM